MVGKEQIAIDVTVPAEEKFSHITVYGHTVFAYVKRETDISMREETPVLLKLKEAGTLTLQKTAQ